MGYTPKAHDPIPPLTPELREIYTKARALIAKPEQHLQGSYAADQNGERVQPTDPSACRFCAYGALLRVIKLDNPEIEPECSDEARQPLLRALEIALDDDREIQLKVIRVNDDELALAELPEHWRSLTPHQRVLAAYDMVLETPDAKQV